MSDCSSRLDSSLSRPLNSSSSHFSRNLRPCPCLSRRLSGPVVALGRVLLLNASLRTPGILSGIFSIVRARGNTKLFDIWSFKGNRLLPLLTTAPTLPIPVGQRTPCWMLTWINLSCNRHSYATRNQLGLLSLLLGSRKSSVTRNRQKRIKIKNTAAL